MISECPNCNQNLRFSDANKTRILTALDKLLQGQTLKFKCPMCKEVIELNPDGSPVNAGGILNNSDVLNNVGVQNSSGVQNNSVMPTNSVMPNNSGMPLANAGLTPNEKNITQLQSQFRSKYADTISVQAPVPPNAPDISWLKSGADIDSDLVEDIQTAMLILPEQSMRNKISEIMKQESYQIYIPKNIDEAIGSLRFKDYAIIVYHSQYENIPLKSQDFHKFIQQMSMNKRRYINYILIGPEFHTLYDLEALANSANLVINDNEITFLSTILIKAKADYKALFHTYCSMLKAHGKN